MSGTWTDIYNIRSVVELRRQKGDLCPCCWGTEFKFRMLITIHAVQRVYFSTTSHVVVVTPLQPVSHFSITRKLFTQSQIPSKISKFSGELKAVSPSPRYSWNKQLSNKMWIKLQTSKCILPYPNVYVI